MRKRNPVSAKKVASHSNIGGILVIAGIVAGLYYAIGWYRLRNGIFVNNDSIGSGSHGFPPLNPVIPNYTDDYYES